MSESDFAYILLIVIFIGILCAGDLITSIVKKKTQEASQ